MILLIDNYDSFSYNLYQLIGTIDPDVAVYRNDAITAEEIERLKPEAVVISPGPGRPQSGTGASYLIERVLDMRVAPVPTLGVCLGHQMICSAFGAEITYAKELMHGKQSVVSIDTSCPIFKGCAPLMRVARYHSLAAAKETIPESLRIIAYCSDGEVMGVWHKELDIFGLQFHPESILTPDGEKIMRNFIDFAKSRTGVRIAGHGHRSSGVLR